MSSSGCGLRPRQLFPLPLREGVRGRGCAQLRTRDSFVGPPTLPSPSRGEGISFCSFRHRICRLHLPRNFQFTAFALARLPVDRCTAEPRHPLPVGAPSGRADGTSQGAGHLSASAGCAVTARLADEPARGLFPTDLHIRQGLGDPASLCSTPGPGQRPATNKARGSLRSTATRHRADQTGMTRLSRAAIPKCRNIR